MSRHAKIFLDQQKLTEYLENSEWDELILFLNNLFNLNVDPETSQAIKFEYSETIIHAFHNILCKLCETTEIKGNVYLALFKAMRNYTLCEFAQNAFVTHEGIMKNTKLSLVNLVKEYKNGDKQFQGCIRMILQFLCNLTIYSTKKLVIYDLVNNLLIDLLKDDQFCYITCALTYNVSKNTNNLEKITENIRELILELYEEYCDKNEYLTYLIEVLLKDESFCVNYTKYKLKYRLNILRILKDMVQREIFDFHDKLLDILKQQFKKQSDCILKTVSDYVEDINVLEVTYLLDILSSLSANDNFLLRLQNDTSLLINCAFLLKNIHALGRETQNNFTPLGSLSEITNIPENIQKHPAFGFKACLVRILGNLCWKNKKNQDELRELEIISVILDCSNIDARNPLIMQWMILATRNLCDGNAENQKIVASLTQQGTVDSATLHEMGLSLHSDGANQISVVSLEALKDLKVNK